MNPSNKKEECTFSIIGGAKLCDNNECKEHYPVISRKSIINGIVYPLPPQESWETNLKKIEWCCFDVSCQEDANKLLSFISKTIAEERRNEQKAFGGCTDCYGKGYATQRETISGGHGKSEIYRVLEPMQFCSCDRGKQLKSHIERIKAEERKRLVEEIGNLLLKKARETDYADRTEFDEAYEIIKNYAKEKGIEL